MLGNLKRVKKGEKGFTLIELLVVAAIIGILLAIAIPNLIKARMSANEASARKSMQALRDAEGEYFEQDMDNNGSRDYINVIGTKTTFPSLRDPQNTGNEEDALIDSSFEGANGAACTKPKAGYCIQFDSANVSANTGGTYDDFGWQDSPSSVNKTGRKDFAVYGDGAIRCTVSSQATAAAGTFEANRDSPGCD
jgi:type IV pilus assembly protein PilA